MQTNFLYTYNVYHDGELQASFTDQPNDMKAFGYVLDHQSASVHHALRYEGWKIEIIDQATGQIFEYPSHKPIPNAV